MTTSLSILAPTHNRPEVLSLVWPTWICQEGIKEIIVVNDGSSLSYDKVFNELKAACEQKSINLKIIVITKRIGAPAAKNIGLAECTSDEILTTDDDILLPEGMISRCRKDRPSLDHPVVVGPRVIYLRDEDTNESALCRANQETLPYFDYKKLTICAWSHPGAVKEFPFISAVAVWPAVLFKKGLRFYEGYGGNGYREETDPQLLAAISHEAKIYLVPEAVCYHLPPSIAYANQGGQRRGGIFWFEYWVLKNNYIFLKRHRTLLNETFNVKPFSSWVELTKSRFSLSRLKKLFKK